MFSLYFERDVSEPGETRFELESIREAVSAQEAHAFLSAMPTHRHYEYVVWEVVPSDTYCGDYDLVERWRGDEWLETFALELQ